MSESGGGRERRLSPRYSASLECGVTIPREERSSGLLFPNTTLAGRTRDLSESGLGLIVPSIYIGYDCVVDQGRTLIISVALPSGDVELRATPVHYVRQSAGGDDETTYFIGLRITETDDAERERYLNFLRGLENSGQG